MVLIFLFTSQRDEIDNASKRRKKIMLDSDIFNNIVDPDLIPDDICPF